MIPEAMENPAAPVTAPSMARVPAAAPDLLSYLDDLLVEQQQLQTPVARFAARLDAGLLSPSALQTSSPSLIPLTAPGPGEQYAFEVDLDSCSGCKACVAGCHALNGLDPDETWRDTGLLVGGDARHPFQQTVTTACHHCADPACLNGCPVLAYEKDPVTGIVRHLDDQCIGCSYCILKCPYDVPKFSQRLGIVRKCDMCHQRLAAGEAPACAQACPTHAIRIVKVETTVATGFTAAPADPAASSPFLPGAPDPSYTQPTTRYVGRRALPADVRPADQNTLRPQPAHWPLVLMLVCTQAALGMQTVALLSTPAPAPMVGSFAGWAALALAAAGLAASVAHLGRPLRAWRVFLGLRRSWLSREAVLFGAWFPALALTVAADPIPPFAGIAALLLGGAGVFCSAMIYVDTRRRAWRAAQTFPRFFGTCAVAAAFALTVTRPGAGALVVLGAALALKLAFEARAARPAGEYARDEPLHPELATARLLTTVCHRAHAIRHVAALAGAGLLVRGVEQDSRIALISAAVLLLGGEVLERHLYFRTVDAPRMPGYAGRETES